jgi:hypothetical protein
LVDVRPASHGSGGVMTNFIWPSQPIGALTYMIHSEKETPVGGV